jgi:hypothetical protein
MVENSNVGPKFRPFSFYISVSLSKFSCTAIDLIIKPVFACTVSTFSSVL